MRNTDVDFGAFRDHTTIIYCSDIIVIQTRIKELKTHNFQSGVLRFADDFNELYLMFL